MMSLAKKHHLYMAELLADIVSAERCPQLTVSGVTIDSRRVKAGDCFIALKGAVTDGTSYIEQAVARGAVAVLADDCSEISIEAASLSVPLLRIKNLATLVSKIAGRFYADPSQHLNLVAFTGTNGKTTCSRLYAQLMAEIGCADRGSKSAFIGTAGYGMVEPQRGQAIDAPFEVSQVTDTGLTTPDAVTIQRILAELVNTGADYVAMEASSHSLVQHRIVGLHINAAVFTNLSRDHLDYHKDLDSYAAAKARLFSMPGLETAVINMDDKVGCDILAGLDPDLKALTFSLENAAADIYCSAMHLSADGISASISTPWGQGQLHSPLLGKFNLANLLAVIAVAAVQGVALTQCLQAIPRLAAVPGRMQLVSSDLQPKVIVDYAHTPDALEKALQALRPHCSGQLWVIFGCGGDRDIGKRSAMGDIAQRHADKVVVTSDNPRTESAQQIVKHILEGIQGEVVVELDRREAIFSAIQQAADQDIVLIAGKGHEDYQIIGAERFPFSDQKEAYLALQATENSGRRETICQTETKGGAK